MSELEKMAQECEQFLLHELEQLEDRALTTCEHGRQNWIHKCLRELENLRSELEQALQICRAAGIGDYTADYYLGRVTETGKYREEIRQLRTELAEQTKLANVALSDLQNCQEQHQKLTEQLAEARRDKERLVRACKRALSEDFDCADSNASSRTHEIRNEIHAAIDAAMSAQTKEAR